jgi:C4-dicarboxylate transporter DctQ subunit
VIGRLAELTSRACLLVAALALLAIVAINGANVVGRYAFGAPFTWAEELMLFLMVLVVFAAAPAVAWRNRHICLEAVVDCASPMVRRVLVAIAGVASIAILLVVVLSGAEIVTLLHAFDQRSDALHLPMWIPQAFLTGGLALTALLIAARLVTSR